MMKNAFFQQVMSAYQNGASREELAELLGRGRAKKGMFEGILDEGELEIGQVSAQITETLKASEIVSEIWNGFNESCRLLGGLGS